MASQRKDSRWTGAGACGSIGTAWGHGPSSRLRCRLQRGELHRGVHRERAGPGLPAGADRDPRRRWRLHRWHAGHPRPALRRGSAHRLVDNPARLQAAGLRPRRARGDIIVRMDVHCEYAPDYVRKCVEALERTGADNVGGAQRAKASPSSAPCAPRSTARSGWAARSTARRAEGFVDTVFLGAFRRRVFETVGLWDPGAITNEDSELNQRILEAAAKSTCPATSSSTTSRATRSRRSRRSTSGTAAAARARCSSSGGSRRCARPSRPRWSRAAPRSSRPRTWPFAPPLRDLRARDRCRGRARRPDARPGPDPDGMGDLPGAPRVPRRRVRRRAGAVPSAPTGTSPSVFRREVRPFNSPWRAASSRASRR